jgi:hypothetical protein
MSVYGNTVHAGISTQCCALYWSSEVVKAQLAHLKPHFMICCCAGSGFTTLDGPLSCVAASLTGSSPPAPCSHNSYRLGMMAFGASQRPNARMTVTRAHLVIGATILSSLSLMRLRCLYALGSSQMLVTPALPVLGASSKQPQDVVAKTSSVTAAHTCSVAVTPTQTSAVSAPLWKYIGNPTCSSVYNEFGRTTECAKNGVTSSYTCRYP